MINRLIRYTKKVSPEEDLTDEVQDLARADDDGFAGAEESDIPLKGEIKSMEPNEKRRELEIQDALAYTENIINTVHDPVIILYEDLKVALANRSFYRDFNVQLEETEGRFIYELGNRQWDIPELRQLLEEILLKNTSFDDFEIAHDFFGIGRRTMVLNACRIYMEGNRTRVIIITIKDITERKKIDELNEEIRRLKKQP